MVFDIFKYILTVNCNFKCYYCYQGKSLGYSNLEDFLKVIGVLEGLNIRFKTLYFYGGEPLLNRKFLINFMKIYSKDYFIKNFGVKDFRIVTNGTNIKTLADMLINWGFYITISIDSINSTCNYKIGRYSNLKEIFGVFFYFRDRDLLNHFSVNIVLTPYNIFYLKKTIKFLVKVIGFKLSQIDLDVAYNIEWNYNGFKKFKAIVNDLFKEGLVKKEMFYNEIAWPTWLRCYDHMIKILTAYKDKLIRCSYFINRPELFYDIGILKTKDYKKNLDELFFSNKRIRYRLCEDEYVQKNKLRFSNIFQEIFN